MWEMCSDQGWDAYVWENHLRFVMLQCPTQETEGLALKATEIPQKQGLTPITLFCTLCYFKYYIAETP